AVGALTIISSPSTVSAAKHALLVGIDDCKHSSINNLTGCENDTERWAEILIKHHDFQLNEIQYPKGSQATMKGIETAFRQNLIDPVQSHDTVVFFFAGHGAFVKDLDGDEADGMDECLCPYDSLQMDPSTWLTDDTLRYWLSQVPTTNVLTVINSCHSGT